MKQKNLILLAKLSNFHCQILGSFGYVWRQGTFMYTVLITLWGDLRNWKYITNKDYIRNNPKFVLCLFKSSYNIISLISFLILYYNSACPFFSTYVTPCHYIINKELFRFNPEENQKRQIWILVVNLSKKVKMKRFQVDNFSIWLKQTFDISIIPSFLHFLQVSVFDTSFLYSRDQNGEVHYLWGINNGR